MLTASCSQNDSKSNFPSQEEIAEKIVGKWKRVSLNGEQTSTNMRQIATYTDQGVMYSSSTYTVSGKYLWENKSPFYYEFKGDNHMYSFRSGDGANQRSVDLYFDVLSIDDRNLKVKVTKMLAGGEDQKTNSTIEYVRVDSDYTQAIIGLWEGVSSSEGIYGDFNHRWEFRIDSTYTYYVRNDSDQWVASDNISNRYMIDGDWLSCEWQTSDGTEYNEWWDIDGIEGDVMNWSAIRDTDSTRVISTMSMQRVN